MWLLSCAAAPMPSAAAAAALQHQLLCLLQQPLLRLPVAVVAAIGMSCVRCMLVAAVLAAMLLNWTCCLCLHCTPRPAQE